MNTPPKLELTPINHVAFIIDESGSMSPHRRTVPEVFDRQIKMLAEQSVKLNQETRVSLYLFKSGSSRCIVYDRDVLRLPSLAGHYNPGGGTPLVRAVNGAFLDLSQTPEIHADHAFLLYVITDGQETEDRSGSNKLLLEQRLGSLKENWTVAALVPDATSAAFCKQLGFEPGNIQVWDCSSAAGLDKASRDISAATQSYMALRASGVKSTKNLFVPQQAGKREDVLKNLQVITNPYTVYKLDPSSNKEPIQPFVERATNQPYTVGAAYYELVKPETIQAQKQICLRTKPDGRLYSGRLDEVRKALGLPTGAEIKVAPAELKDFQVFIQSTSVNRNVIPGQQVLVIKL